MTASTFKALETRQQDDGSYTRVITEKKIDDLPEGDVLVRVHFSSLNYKDALSANGHKGVTRKYPHTPGIDAAGIVEESSSDRFSSGDPVIVTSYDLGMNTSGGFGQYIRVPESWIVPLPKGLTLSESMMFGTAGFTAALALFKLQRNEVTPEKGEILVTGATGGVGSLAIALLAKAGYQVVAATGKTDQLSYLQSLGAGQIIGREELEDPENRPLLKKRWAGAIDTVGGAMLAAVLKSTHHEGSVASCGNAASNDLPLNVFPFILRGVNLLGVDSANCEMETRHHIWQKLATDWKLNLLGDIVREIPLEELDREITRMLEGKHKGRVLINLQE